MDKTEIARQITEIMDEDNPEVQFRRSKAVEILQHEYKLSWETAWEVVIRVEICFKMGLPEGIYSS